MTKTAKKSAEKPILRGKKKWITQSLKGAEELTGDLLLCFYDGPNCSCKAYGHEDIPTVAEYVKTGTFPFKCTTDRGVYGILRDGSELFVVAPDGVLTFVSKRLCLDSFKKDLLQHSGKISATIGAIVPFSDTIIIVKDGDDVEEEIVGGVSDMPTISFRCLARFFTKNNSTDQMDDLSISGIKALQNGTILDFSPDETRKLTAAQQTRIKEAKCSPVGRARHCLSLRANNAKVFPPEPGFVLVKQKGAYIWHRSGSFLLNYKNQTILMGVDELVYFGCELADKAKTLKAAYESLIPKAIRKLNCPRQGEWFAVATDEVYKETSPEVLAIACYESDPEFAISLPIDHPDAARHQVTGDLVLVTKEGIIAKNPMVAHSEDEHEELFLSGWYRFVRNTAKRSFSEQGVD